MDIIVGFILILVVIIGGSVLLVVGSAVLSMMAGCVAFLFSILLLVIGYPFAWCISKLTGKPMKRYKYKKYEHGGFKLQYRGSMFKCW